MRTKPIILLSFFVFLIGACQVAADSGGDGWVELTPERCRAVDGVFGFVPVDTLWRYLPGDDPAWASPTYNDSSWLSASTVLAKGAMPEGGWFGIGWFRLHLRVDSTLIGAPLSFRVANMGALELYLDGKKVKSFGRVAQDGQKERIQLAAYPFPWTIKLTDSVHVLAVRFSNHRVETFHSLGGPAGFAVEIGRAPERPDQILGQWGHIRAHQYLATGATSALALVFSLIYFFGNRNRRNLFFALLATGCALLTYWPFEFNSSASVSRMLTADFMFKLGLISVTVLGNRFLYELFYFRPPFQYRIIAIAGLLLLAVSWAVPFQAVYVFVMLGIVEMLRVVTVALVRKKQGATVIATGFAIFGLGSAYQIMMDWTWLPPPIEGFLFPYILGIVALLVAMSFHLACDVAQTNRKLLVQLNQVRELSEKTIEQEVRRNVLERDIEIQRHKLEEAQKLEEAMKQLETAHERLKETQSQLIQSEKMASLGMLVAGIAHEINTPVGAISSMHDTSVRAFQRIKQALTGKGESADQPGVDTALKAIDDANRVIESGTDRVITIVRRLRSFARLDEAELKKVDIHEGIEDTLTLIHHELKHRIEVVRDFGDLPLVTCYPSRLNQVFLNLLNNARQAIEGEGKITIRTRRAAEGVQIQFEDTGRGIDPAYLKRVFDPGFTTKGVGVGTGLGLSICYQIIEDHKGRISAQSQPGHGTVFTIVLPIDPSRSSLLSDKDDESEESD